MSRKRTKKAVTPTVDPRQAALFVEMPAPPPAISFEAGGPEVAGVLVAKNVARLALGGVTWVLDLRAGYDIAQPLNVALTEGTRALPEPPMTPEAIEKAGGPKRNAHGQFAGGGGSSGGGGGAKGGAAPAAPAKAYSSEMSRAANNAGRAASTPGEHKAAAALHSQAASAASAKYGNSTIGQSLSSHHATQAAHHEDKAKGGAGNGGMAGHGLGNAKEVSHVKKFSNGALVEYGWQSEEMHEYFIAKGCGPKGVMQIRRKADGWVAGMAKSLVPYVLSEDAIAKGAMPSVGVSALPKTLESCVPARFQYWKAEDPTTARATRDALVESGMFSERLVKMVDGEMRLCVEKFYLYEPEETAPVAAPVPLAEALGKVFPPEVAVVSPLAEGGDWREVLKRDVPEALFLSPRDNAEFEAVVAELALGEVTKAWVLEGDDTPETHALFAKLGPAFYVRSPEAEGRVFVANIAVPSSVAKDAKRDNHGRFAGGSGGGGGGKKGGNSSAAHAASQAASGAQPGHAAAKAHHEAADAHASAAAVHAAKGNKKAAEQHHAAAVEHRNKAFEHNLVAASHSHTHEKSSPEKISAFTTLASRMSQHADLSGNAKAHTNAAQVHTSLAAMHEHASAYGSKAEGEAHKAKVVEHKEKARQHRMGADGAQVGKREDVENGALVEYGWQSEEMHEYFAKDAKRDNHGRFAGGSGGGGGGSHGGGSSPHAAAAAAAHTAAVAATTRAHALVSAMAANHPKYAEAARHLADAKTKQSAGNHEHSHAGEAHAALSDVPHAKKGTNHTEAVQAVHLARASQSDAAGKARRASQTKSDADIGMRIAKADGQDERYVLGIVLEPEVVDAQNDIYSAEEIRSTAHGFMERFRNIGLMHKGVVNEKVKILESYIAPADMTFGEGESATIVKAGTWMMAVRVLDDELWQSVRGGGLTGFSIGGSAIRKPDAPAQPATA